MTTMPTFLCRAAKQIVWMLALAGVCVFHAQAQTGRSEQESVIATLTRFFGPPAAASTPETIFVLPKDYLLAPEFSSAGELLRITLNLPKLPRRDAPGDSAARAAWNKKHFFSESEWESIRVNLDTIKNLGNVRPEGKFPARIVVGMTSTDRTWYANGYVVTNLMYGCGVPDVCVTGAHVFYLHGVTGVISIESESEWETVVCVDGLRYIAPPKVVGLQSRSEEPTTIVVAESVEEKCSGADK